MSNIKLKAVTKDYIWGGRKLKNYGIVSDSAHISEAWTLSFHTAGECECEESGKKLSEIITRADWGENAKKSKDFPIIIKLIDAAQNLSVQVHPNDEYALKNENSFGKSEMWYIAEADIDACIYVGFKRKVGLEQYRESIAKGEVLNLMNKFNVKEGDCYYIPAGTLHAIGAGCTIVEIQQNSNITYRVYDYNRIGADGKPRELHVAKAVECTDLSVYKMPKFTDVLCRCEYFTAKKLDGSLRINNKDSFTAINVLCDGGFVDGNFAKKGDAYFIKASEEAYLEKVSAIITYIE